MNSNQKLSKITIEEIENALSISKHILIQIENIDFKDALTLEIANILKENINNILLVDLSNQGENNRPNGENGLGTITNDDIKHSNFIIANAINVQNQEQAFLRYSFLTNSKTGIFITNSCLPNDEYFFKNPIFETFENFVKLSINTNGDIQLVNNIKLFKIENEENIEQCPTRNDRILL